MRLAAERGAAICVFSELAVTGFHRRIRDEATPEKVDPAVACIRSLCKSLGMACAVDAPSFGAGARVYNSYLHIDERGQLAGQVDKTGLTVAEATFFHGGWARPVAVLQGRKVSAVMCREIEDSVLVEHHLPPGAAELIFWPGLIGTSPEPGSNDVGEEAQRLARRQTAWLIQNNWPGSLNLPDDDPLQTVLGGSRVIAPSGELMLRLPMRAAGLATFDIGATEFTWDALADPIGPT